MERRSTAIILVATAILGSGVQAEPIGAAGRLRVAGGRLVDAAGHPVALYGVNLFQSHLMWSRRQDAAEVEAALTAIARLGFNAVRLPLNMAWYAPRPGVFPDHPEHAGILASHRLPTGTPGFYDAIVRRAGELGLYVIPEFHELPSDLYRWFVGGEERDRGTERPGRAIAWMARPLDDRPGQFRPDPELAAREVPRTLGWLAAHWRGIPNIAAIEIPWNEPGGPLTEGEAYYNLCRECAQAVKAADPERLVFMNCVDWGAMVNRLPDESVWRLPDEVDALFPHFYAGMHSGSSGAAGTWSATMANWASWLLGSGKPVLVGEYGVVEMKRATYWAAEVTDEQRARTYAACLAQWHAMGVQGVFGWAWGGGIGYDAETAVPTQGAEVLPKWSAPYREALPDAATAAVGIVCHPKYRSPYGDRRHLWSVTEALLDAHLTPFATVFASQVEAQPEVLSRFRALLVLEADLSDAVQAAAAAAGRPVFRLGSDAAQAASIMPRVRDALGLGPATLPPNVLVACTGRQATVFERHGRAGEVTLRLVLPGAEGSGRLIDERGREVFAGAPAALAETGAVIHLSPWECAVLRWER